MTRRIAVYCDGADLQTMARLLASDGIAGATTNPSLMRKAGITDYRRFAREVLALSCGKPVSFEVLADDPAGINAQAREITTWGENVVVKVPIVNALGLPNDALIAALTADGIRVNVTAIFTSEQAVRAAAALRCPGCILSVFAGRIADAGVHPTLTVIDALMAGRRVGALTLWASARQVYSVIEAERAGADIITLTPDLIAKLDGFGRDLDAYSVETVRQFVKDAEGIQL